MSKVITPNYREGISAQNEITGQNEYLYSSNHALNVSVVGSSTGDVNLTEIDGNPVSVDTGNSDNGTQRVVLASDQPPIETLEQTGLVPVEYDYISASYPNATTETYSYYTGGSGGALAATITVVYTDSTKDFISTITRT